MSDLIGELRKITGDLFYNQANDAGCTARDELLRVIKQYGWHPVSEPPEKEGYYFVTAKRNDPKIGESKTYTGVFLFFKFSGCLEREWYCDDEVIAWMPRLEPYQPKGE